MITRCQAAAWRVLLANSCAGQRSMFTAATSAVPLEQSRFVAPAGADAPTVVLDLDETILHRRSWRDSAKLYTMPTASTGLPFPGAVDTISRHTTNYRFVCLPSTALPHATHCPHATRIAQLPAPHCTGCSHSPIQAVCAQHGALAGAVWPAWLASAVRHRHAPS